MKALNFCRKSARFVLVILALVSIGVRSSAQTTAMDWTKADCDNGVSHHLFSELDSGYVIIQEYVMLDGCQPCITAGNVLLSLKAQREASHPGKIRIYQTAFFNGNTCQEMTDWATDNGFTTNTQFKEGQFEVSYYGGMGMPTTVILSGSDHHKVWYNHQGSLSGASDQTAFLNALDSAIASSLGVKSPSGLEGLTYGPNPTTGIVNWTFRERMISYTISSIEGKILSQKTIRGRLGVESFAMDLSGLPTGPLLVELKGEKGGSSVIQIMHMPDGE